MAINLTIEQVKVLLKKSGQTISQEIRAGNNRGTVLKLANGCNVNCWDKGTVNCQGKNVSEIEKLLSAPTTGIPQNNKVLLFTDMIKMQEHNWRQCFADGIWNR